MGYVLTKEDPGGRIYALITPTRLIDYTVYDTLKLPEKSVKIP